VPTAGGAPALRRLVAAGPERFANEHWGRAPLLSPADALPRDFTDLFGEDAVDELVSRRGLRAPFLRVAKDGTTLGGQAFTAPGGIGAGIGDQVSDDRVLALFADGATLVLQGLHRTWSPLIDFSQALAADLAHPTQVNAYVTPAKSRGFSDHYDVHDVFVLQVAGEKRWKIGAPVHTAPLRDQPWTTRRAAVEAAAAADPLLETTLRPGDCLYLPRGYLHAATALGAVSIHLTIGVHPWTRRHLADALVAAALDLASERPDVRASLPLGADVSDAGALARDAALVRSAVADALTQVDTTVLAATLARQAGDAQRAAPLAPLAQSRAAAELHGDQALAVRPHLAARLHRDGEGRAVLASRAGSLPLEDADVPAVAELLSRGAAPVAALGQPLSRRLLLAGVVVTA
jgi:lysine-specific demethylase/histidyl-hydroxylase NO66